MLNLERRRRPNDLAGDEIPNDDALTGAGADDVTAAEAGKGDLVDRRYVGRRERAAKDACSRVPDGDERALGESED